MSQILSQILFECLSQILSPKTFAAAAALRLKKLGKPVQNFGHNFGHNVGKPRQNFGQHFGHNVGKTRFLIVNLTMSEMLSEFLPTFAQNFVPKFAQVCPTLVRIFVRGVKPKNLKLQNRLPPLKIKKCMKFCKNGAKVLKNRRNPEWCKGKNVELEKC